MLVRLNENVRNFRTASVAVFNRDKSMKKVELRYEVQPFLGNRWIVESTLSRLVVLSEKVCKFLCFPSLLLG